MNEMRVPADECIHLGAQVLDGFLPRRHLVVEVNVDDDARVLSSRTRCHIRGAFHVSHNDCFRCVILLSGHQTYEGGK